jgi:diaminohydroxyphosphoribosylaminopyrimidine deaminase / 5-amino-6-(5-phosphoribosylamino)uracil reductase
MAEGASPGDREMMRRALALAERGWGRVAPNPLVGALVVRGGEVVGEGWHAEYGRPHAEAAALDAAGEAARGATLYVTLEPCAHHGKTPPCTEAILRAGIRRGGLRGRGPEPQGSGRRGGAARGGGSRAPAAWRSGRRGTSTRPSSTATRR